MARAVCPNCGALVIITPTGEQIGEWGSALWWTLALHPVKEELAGSIVVWEECEGSGKKV